MASATTRNTTSFAAGLPRSASGAPRSTMPRTSSTKCVSGSTCAIHCAARGMPSNGNMNPESRIDGSIVKKASWNAWNCVRASVEITSPSVSVAAMKSSAAR
jgi:hypothetical protein